MTTTTDPTEPGAQVVKTWHPTPDRAVSLYDSGAIAIADLRLTPDEARAIGIALLQSADEARRLGQP
jgi:hypothetical protein